MNTIDKHLFTALDNYPFNLEETIESLGYALSYDEKNTTALCLYGRLMAEQLQKYDLAISYFENALSHDVHALEVYVPYIETLIKNEDFDKAQSLIDFSLSVKGSSKIELLFKQLQLHEISNDIKSAHKTLKAIESKVYSNDYQYFIEEAFKRLKSKIESKKSKKKKK